MLATVKARRFSMLRFELSSYRTSTLDHRTDRPKKVLLANKIKQGSALSSGLFAYYLCNHDARTLDPSRAVSKEQRMPSTILPFVYFRVEAKVNTLPGPLASSVAIDCDSCWSFGLFEA